MGKNIQILVSGVIAIGIVTALTLPDRKTAQVATAGGKAAQGLLGTAITGKA